MEQPEVVSVDSIEVGVTPGGGGRTGPSSIAGLTGIEPVAMMMFVGGC